MPTTFETICARALLAWLKTHGEPVCEQDWQWQAAGQAFPGAILDLGRRRCAVMIGNTKTRILVSASPGVIAQEADYPASLRELGGKLEREALAAGLLGGWYELTWRGPHPDHYIKPAVFAALRQQVLLGMRGIQALQLPPFGLVSLRLPESQAAWLVKLAEVPHQLDCARIDFEVATAPAAQRRLREALGAALVKAVKSFEAGIEEDFTLAETDPLLVLLNTNPWADANAIRLCLEGVPEKSEFLAIFSLSLSRVLSLVYSQVPGWGFETELDSI